MVDLSARTLPERIRSTVEHLRERGLTDEKIAERVGVSVQSLYKWMNGKVKNPRLDDLAKLADITPRALRDGESAMQPLKPETPVTATEQVAAMELVNALPQAERAMWLAMGYWLRQYASTPPGNGKTEGH